jgi:hypothetical protein
MCHLVSWIEYKDEVYFITDSDLNTKEGRALKKYLGYPNQSYWDDIKGHGAIREFYELRGKGRDKECTDFSNPKNFPHQIVDAIKQGKFTGIGVAEGLLTQVAWAEYQKVRQVAEAEYQKVRQPAWAEYQKVRQVAEAEYQKVTQVAFWKLVRIPENRIEAWRLAE